MLSNTLILQWHEDANTVPKRYLLYFIVFHIANGETDINNNKMKNKHNKLSEQ
jgi:hypothetical protein